MVRLSRKQFKGADGVLPLMQTCSLLGDWWWPERHTMAGDPIQFQINGKKFTGIYTLAIVQYDVLFNA